MRNQSSFADMAKRTVFVHLTTALSRTVNAKREGKKNSYSAAAFGALAPPRSLQLDF